MFIVHVTQIKSKLVGWPDEGQSTLDQQLTADMEVSSVIHKSLENKYKKTVSWHSGEEGLQMTKNAKKMPP